jgi:hypothetical protein
VSQQIAGESSDAPSALRSTDWLALGFEIIDCPFPQWKFQPSDFVASFGLHTALVIGEKIPVRPELIPTLVDELGRFKVRTVKSGEFVEEGSGKNSLNSPALCLAELSAAIAKRSPSHPLSAVLHQIRQSSLVHACAESSQLAPRRAPIFILHAQAVFGAAANAQQGESARHRA